MNTDRTLQLGVGEEGAGEDENPGAPEERTAATIGSTASLPVVFEGAESPVSRPVPVEEPATPAVPVVEPEVLAPSEVLDVYGETLWRSPEEGTAETRSAALAQIDTNVAKQRVLGKLRSAANSRNRTYIYAVAMDIFHIDSIVGLIPALGDISTSTVSSIYFTLEGINSGIPFTSILKILATQTGDAAVGTAIPLPGVGTVLDASYQANMKGYGEFQKHFESLVAETRSLDIPEEEIIEAILPSENLGKALSAVNTVVEWDSGIREAVAGRVSGVINDAATFISEKTPFNVTGETLTYLIRTFLTSRNRKQLQ